MRGYQQEPGGFLFNGKALYGSVDAKAVDRKDKCSYILKTIKK